MQTSIATVSVSGTLQEKMTALAAAGYDAQEVFEPEDQNSIRLGRLLPISALKPVNGSSPI